MQKTAIKLEVTNVDTNEIIVYLSIGAAAKALGIRQISISTYLKKGQTTPFRGKYLFKAIV